MRSLVTFRHSALVLAVSGLVTVALFAPAVQARAPLVDERGVLTMAPMLEKPTSAVVSISVATRVPGADNPLLRDPFFRRYFGLPDTDAGRQAMSAGSGVIIDAKKGHVVTNHHVIRNAERIMVTVKDGRQLKAELIGSDAATDIALLKVEARNLSAIEIADSDQLKVGDVVLAIGNPFGLGQTVTSGIVSALGRSGLTAENYEDFIQTDAPINPGNSGGALIDAEGNLVGINSAIYSRSGGSMGIGFAIPVSLAKQIMEQIIRQGSVTRGWIGIEAQDITPELAESFRLKRTSGSLIAGILPNSPAQRAGLRPGDVLLEIDGREVLDSSTMLTLISGLKPERKATLKILRNQQEIQVTVTIGKRPKPQLARLE
jgi:serine protease DegQ